MRMMLNGYLYCKCIHVKEEYFSYVRFFAEKMFAKLNCQIKRYSVGYLDENGKHTFKSLLYTKSKKERFDTIPLNLCGLMIFSCPNPKAEIREDKMCVYLEHHKEASVYSFSVTWEVENYDEEEFLTIVGSLKNEIQQCFCIDYLFSGCMETGKESDIFLLGIQTDTRTDFENEVAQNIALATYDVDDRLPYLFPYTYIADKNGKENEGQTIIFHSLILEPIEQYCRNTEWKKCYDTMLKKNMIIPLRKV